MSESLHHHSGESEDKDLNNVIDITDRLRDDDGYLDPEELSDIEVLDAFLSPFRHPSMETRSSSDIAEAVIDQLGHLPDKDFSAQQLAWRSRLMELMVDVDNVDDSVLDDWLENDEPLGLIYEALQKTRGVSEDMGTERKALLELRHLRGGVLNREQANLDDDEQWIRLIHKLMRSES